MDVNAYYYTLSTISQTLAGAFGFLIAVALHRAQNLKNRMKIEYRTAAMQRGLDTDQAEDAERDETWHWLIQELDKHPNPEPRSDAERRDWLERDKNESRFRQK